VAHSWAPVGSVAGRCPGALDLKIAEVAVRPGTILLRVAAASAANLSIAITRWTVRSIGSADGCSGLRGALSLPRADVRGWLGPARGSPSSYRNLLLHDWAKRSRRTLRWYDGQPRSPGGRDDTFSPRAACVCSESTRIVTAGCSRLGSSRMPIRCSITNPAARVRERPRSRLLRQGSPRTTARSCHARSPRPPHT